MRRETFQMRDMQLMEMYSSKKMTMQWVWREQPQSKGGGAEDGQSSAWKWESAGGIETQTWLLAEVVLGLSGVADGLRSSHRLKHADREAERVNVIRELWAQEN